MESQARLMTPTGRLASSLRSPAVSASSRGLPCPRPRVQSSPPIQAPLPDGASRRGAIRASRAPGAPSVGRRDWSRYCGHARARPFLGQKMLVEAGELPDGGAALWPPHSHSIQRAARGGRGYAASRACATLALCDEGRRRLPLSDQAPGRGRGIERGRTPYCAPRDGAKGGARCLAASQR